MREFFVQADEVGGAPPALPRPGPRKKEGGAGALGGDGRREARPQPVGGLPASLPPPAWGGWGGAKVCRLPLSGRRGWPTEVWQPRDPRRSRFLSRPPASDGDWAEGGFLPLKGLVLSGPCATHRPPAELPASQPLGLPAAASLWEVSCPGSSVTGCRAGWGPARPLSLCSFPAPLGASGAS